MGVTLLDSLLQAEASQDLLRFRFSEDDIPLWPYIRFKVLWHAYRQLSGVTYRPDSRVNLVKSPSGPGVSENAKEIISTVQRLPESPMLVFTSAVHRVTKRDMHYNKYASPLMRVVGNGLMMEENQQTEIFNASSSTFNHAYAFQYGRLMRPDVKPARHDATEIDALIDVLYNGFPLNTDLQLADELKAELRVISARLPAWKQFYELLFARTQPKLIVVENACYGKRSHLIRWAKDCNVRVAEFQHGFLDTEHIPYNFPATTSEDFSSHYLPDDMLFYGQFWADNCRLPVTAVPIGNPYFEESYQEKATIEQRILFCIAGFDADKVLSTLKSLLNRFNDMKIYVRPHPKVRELVDNMIKPYASRVCLSDSQHVPFLEDLAGAKWVVSEPSTVIFESLAAGKPTFLLPTRPCTYTDIDGLERVETLLESHEGGGQGNCSQSDEKASHYFKADWQTNFLRYWQSFS